MIPEPQLAQTALNLDTPKEAARIQAAIRVIVAEKLKRRGAVVGLSGGVDSSVAAALCVRALGRGRVLGLLMPEAESSEQSLRLGRAVAAFLNIEARVEDITSILIAAGCYERRDAAIRSVIPEYVSGWRCKLALNGAAAGSAYPIFSVVVRSPEGLERAKRLTAASYLGIVAASNFKQRTRQMLEYYYADRLKYAVVGTPNRLEYDQGFFVKNGDGAADLKPLAHLYKTQVYQLAEYLGIPEEVLVRAPTTDTYSLEQSQEEFYFGLPHDKIDLCLFGKDHGLPPAGVASAAQLSARVVAAVYREIDAKRRAARYLHAPPILVEQAAGRVPSGTGEV